MELITRAKYEASLKPLRAFCATLKESFPPAPRVLAEFLKKLSGEGYSFSSIRGTLSAVRDLWRHASGACPCDDPLVVSVRNAAAKLAPAPKPRNAISRAHLLAIAKAHSHKQKSVAFTRDWLMLLLAYRGALRGDEVVHLLASDAWVDTCDPVDEACVHFPPEMTGQQLVWLRISSSKTNSQRQRRDADRAGDTVVIGPDMNPDLCPVRWFLRWKVIRDKSAKFLFPSQNKNNTESIGRSRFSETVKDLCAGANIKTVLTGHSARAGSATDAIRRGVDLKIVKDHGRWKSDAVFLYIKDDTAARLKVSVALGGYHSADRKSSAADSFSAGAISDLVGASTNQAGIAVAHFAPIDPTYRQAYWSKVQALSKTIGLAAARDRMLFALDDSDL